MIEQIQQKEQLKLTNIRSNMQILTSLKRKICSNTIKSLGGFNISLSRMDS